MCFVGMSGAFCGGSCAPGRAALADGSAASAALEASSSVRSQASTTRSSFRRPPCSSSTSDALQPGPHHTAFATIDIAVSVLACRYGLLPGTAHLKTTVEGLMPKRCLPGAM